jgi:2-oxoisovalerate dehydrogenase E1 component
MSRLADEEVACEIVVPSLLAPLPRKTLTNHLGKRRRIVVIEEAPAEFGFSAELAAALLEAGYHGSYRRFAPPPVPIPAARSLEAAVLRSEEDIFDGVVEMMLEDLASAS